MDDFEAYTSNKYQATIQATQISPQNYRIIFHKDNEEIGSLDFNGPIMKFEGALDTSAKIFFELVAKSFSGRLSEERKAEREECAKVCEEEHHNWRWDDEPDSDSGPRTCAASIRNRSNVQDKAALAERPHLSAELGGTGEK